MKFEIVRICFSGDVFAAFAVVVALAPNIAINKTTLCYPLYSISV